MLSSCRSRDALLYTLTCLACARLAPPHPRPSAHRWPSRSRAAWRAPQPTAFNARANFCTQHGVGSVTSTTTASELQVCIIRIFYSFHGHRARPVDARMLSGLLSPVRHRSPQGASETKQTFRQRKSRTHRFPLKNSQHSANLCRSESTPHDLMDRYGPSKSRGSVICILST